MHAIVQHEYGGPGQLKYEEIADPKPGSGEVLVKVAATSVNPIDWKIRSGAVKDRMPVDFPHIPGRDVAGTVLAVGEGVTHFELGDRVMALTRSTYAEQVVVPASDLAIIPDELDIADAAAVPLVATTGHQLITRAVGAQQGWTILVTGAVGSVGRFAVYTAQQLGCNVLVGVRASQRKEAEALHANGIVALDSRSDLAGLPQLDAVADTVGGEIANQLLSHLRPDGVFGSVATPPSEAEKFPGIRVNRIMAQPDAKALGELAQAVAIGKLKLPIDRILPLAQAGEAQQAAEKGGIGKVLLSV